MKINNLEIKNLKGFLKEKDLFYILGKISASDESALYSDLDSYLIGQSAKKLPIWIWSKENISKDKLFELKKDLDKLLEKGQNKITSKKELYELLNNDYNLDDYFEMGYLSCDKVIKPDNKNGIFVRPNYSDVITLANYWIANEKEMDKLEISMNDAIEEAQSWIDSKTFYVLKDNTGKIVCMAGYSLLDDIAKITHVYTPPEERGKGYCKSLIYSLTKKLLEEKYTPMLYTNYNYPASNKSYKGVGFEDKGILINYKIVK